jgi:hypothetical protein
MEGMKWVLLRMSKRMLIAVPLLQCHLQLMENQLKLNDLVMNR